MNVTPAAKGLAAAGATACLLALTAGPADATLTRTYSKAAVVELVELGPVAGAPGNVHVGHLEFYDRPDGDWILGYVHDYQCPPEFGIAASDDYEDVRTQIDGACAWAGEGIESMETGDIRIRTTADQSWTKVQGYFDSSDPARPRIDVDLRLRGTGAITETVSVTRFPGYKETTRVRARSADVTGTVGAVGIGDEPDDLLFAGESQRRFSKVFTW